MNENVDIFNLYVYGKFFASIPFFNMLSTGIIRKIFNI